MDDTAYNELLCWLKNKDYPLRVKNLSSIDARKSEKRKLRSKAKEFHESNGMIYRNQQKVLRRNEVESVLQTMHSGMTICEKMALCLCN